MNRFLCATLIVSLALLAGCGGKKKDKDTVNPAAPASGDTAVTAAVQAAKTFNGAASPRELLQFASQASGEQALGLMEPKWQRFFLAMSQAQEKLAAKTEQAAAVIESKVGKEQAAQIRGMAGSRIPRPAAPAGLGGIRNAALDTVTIKESGDAATIQIMGRDYGMQMIKEGGRWYWHIPSAEDPALAAPAKMYDALSAALDSLVAAANAGKVTPENFPMEFAKAMSSAAEVTRPPVPDAKTPANSDDDPE